MADPVLVPATPVVVQGQPIPDSPEQIASTQKSVQDIFDRVLPAKGNQPQPEPKPVAPPSVPSEQDRAPAQAPPAEPLPSSEQPTAPAPEPTRIPSFIEKALDVAPSQPESAQPAAVAGQAAQPPVADEIPEEPPVAATEESRNNWKRFREEYKKLKNEVSTLRNKPILDDQTKGQLEFLQNQNKEMAAHLERMSVETHQDFQQKIIRPMHGAWQEAAKIVQEAGGNPDDLAKALALSGRSHFDALDEIFRELPESAKAEAQPAIAAYRRLDDQRKAAIADSPRTIQALKQADLKRQHEFLQQQKQEMVGMFDDAVRILRDEAKVEILQTSTDPDAKWWNDQAAAMIDTSRKLYLDNTDLKKVAMACVLAPAADVYRKMWLAERAARLKTDKAQSDRYGSEPTLSESGGNSRGETPSMQEDLKKPFADVFLREFHRARAQGGR